MYYTDKYSKRDERLSYLSYENKPRHSRSPTGSSTQESKGSPTQESTAVNNPAGIQLQKTITIYTLSSLFMLKEN